MGAGVGVGVAVGVTVGVAVGAVVGVAGGTRNEAEVELGSANGVASGERACTGSTAACAINQSFCPPPPTHNQSMNKDKAVARECRRTILRADETSFIAFFPKLGASLMPVSS